MVKVLLVFDEYNELMSIETSLRKVGFDVVGVSNEYTLGDQLLSLNPDIVVASGVSSRVSSLSIGRKLKENTRWHGKSILIFPAGVKPSATEILKVRADIFLESPLSVHTLVTLMCELMGVDPSSFIEKLVRFEDHHDGAAGRSSSPMSFGKGGAAGNKERVFVRGAGEKSQEAVLASEEEDGSLFADIDLSNLEKELLGGEVSPSEKPSSAAAKPDFSIKPEISTEKTKASMSLKGNSSSDTSDAVIPKDKGTEGSHENRLGESQDVSFESELIKAEIAQAEKLSEQKKQKYSSAISQVKLAAKSTLARVETRKRQKEMRQDWKEEDLEEQDKLRRQFAKALFKK